MPALLLTLSLWHAPALPAYASRLSLLSIASTDAASSSPAAATPTLSPPEAPRLDPVNRLLGEGVGAVVLYLVGQAVVAGVEAGLVVGVDAITASTPLGAVLIIFGTTVAVLDVFGGPILLAEGARIAAGMLGEGSLELGRSVAGAYVGAGLGVVLWATIVGGLAAADPTANNSPPGGSLSPLAITAIVAGLLLPLGGGIGASIGLHWNDGDPDRAPAPPPHHAGGPVVAPPVALPPGMEPPPRAQWLPLPRLPTVTVLSLPFG